MQITLARTIYPIFLFFLLRMTPSTFLRAVRRPDKDYTDPLPHERSRRVPREWEGRLKGVPSFLRSEDRKHASPGCSKTTHFLFPLPPDSENEGPAPRWHSQVCIFSFLADYPDRYSDAALLITGATCPDARFSASLLAWRFFPLLIRAARGYDVACD